MNHRAEEAEDVGGGAAAEVAAAESQEATAIAILRAIHYVSKAAAAISKIRQDLKSQKRML